MSRVLELTRELTARPSLTPDDAGCQRLISERLAAAGFQCRMVSVWRGQQRSVHAGPGFALALVPGAYRCSSPGPEELWTFLPFHPDEKGGELYGRGVADMKGAVAAMVVALENYVAVQQPGPRQEQLGLLLTSDEEGEAVDGVVKCRRTN